MSIITFPSTLKVAKFSWGQQRRDVEFRSSFGAQALEVDTPLWVATVTAPTIQAQADGGWQVLLMQLQGRTNQLALYNRGRPQPLGTMRGAMQFNANAAAGDTTISIVATGETSKTLLAGDYIGFGSTTTQQVVMVLSDATSDGSGVISVNVQPPLRNAFLAGDAITWDQPKALFRQKSSSPMKWDYEPKIVSGFMLDLIEDWRT
jgi:hypothetical protein